MQFRRTHRSTNIHSIISDSGINEMIINQGYKCKLQMRMPVIGMWITIKNYWISINIWKETI